MSRWCVHILGSLLLVSGTLRAQIFRPVTCRNPYTQQQETELGGKVVAEVYKQQPVLPDSAPIAQYIEQLGERLAAVAPRTPGLQQQWPFRFHVVASDEINAFALPGGTMFVDLGAIQAAETEAQLAGVMAHEMSHVILRHSTCNLAKQRNRGFLYALGAIGSSVLLGGTAGSLAAQGIGTVQNLDFLHMSRGDEEQADLLGVQILHDAGFDPRGLAQFFEIIIAKYGRGGAQFLSDHPNPGNRTDYVNREIAQLTPLANPIKSTAAFTESHALAAREHALSPAEMQRGTWRGSGLYASSPGVVADKIVDTSVSPAGSTGGGGAKRTAPGPGQAAQADAPRLTDSQLGLNEPLIPYQADRFGISRPAGWTVVAAPGSTGAPTARTVALAPVGGSGNFGLSYGLVLGWRAEQVAISDAATLQAASERVAQELISANGLTPAGESTARTVAGQPAMARSFRGVSPLAGGTGEERDWLITVARPDGDLDTLLFVAPAAQSAALQPLFERMLATFKAQ